MSAWFDSAFDDFMAELESDGSEITAGARKLMKLAFLAGAREAMEYSKAALTEELD